MCAWNNFYFTLFFRVKFLYQYNSKKFYSAICFIALGPGYTRRLVVLRLPFVCLDLIKCFFVIICGGIQKKYLQTS